jgi:hypothetical protein
MRGTQRFFDDSTTAITGPDKYAINMAWINRSLQENQNYIFPCNSESELIKQFLERAWKWQTANPDAAVSIWYDGQFTSYVT